MPKRLLCKTSIKVDVYGVEVNISVVNTPKDVGDRMKVICKRNDDKNRGDVKLEACGYTATFPNDPTLFYLIYCAECMNVNIVTHETDHLRAFIMEYKGIEDEEASANLSGYLNELVFKFLRDNNFNI